MRHRHIPAQPFLKWAGGKGQLLEQYERFFPREPMHAYYEPFVGSGAVFFHLRERGLFSTYHLWDINAELINCYLAVRDQVDTLIALLGQHRDRHLQDGKDYFYAVRDWDRQPPNDYSRVVRAARMIYLNKTCYNGLWRVNSRGYFNVPIGRYKNPDILSENRLRAASRALQGVDIGVMSFDAVLDQAQPGDFIYFDPPYWPVSETANFTSYSADSFGPDEQRALAKVFARLAHRGCRVMLSNSDTPFVRELYADFCIETVDALRRINSNVGRRGMIREVVVTNYSTHTL